MSQKYNIRYPLQQGITEADIKDAAREWIEESRWYQFTETNFPPEEKEGTLIQVGEGRTAWFKHFEYSKEDGKQKVSYYGYRLETTDPLNRKWRAEAVFELNPNQPWMYVSNACYLNDINLPATPARNYRYPRITRVMLDRNLLGADNGLIIGRSHRVSQLTDQERDILQQLMAERKRVELPFLCIHANGTDRWKDLLQEVTSPYLARTLHVYLCFDEEDEKAWEQIIRDCDWIREKEDDEAVRHEMSVMELLHPQTGYYRCTSFPEMEYDWELVDEIMEQIERIRLTLPADSPNWDWLHLNNTIVPSTADAESYYILMNQALASRLQEARKQHHMTQKELADKTGSTLILISRLERLQTRKVKRELIYDIERTLGLEKNELARLGSREKGPSVEKETAEVERIVGKTEDRFPDNAMNAVGEAKFCHMCGTLLKPQSRFCHCCGARITL